MSRRQFNDMVVPGLVLYKPSSILDPKELLISSGMSFNLAGCYQDMAHRDLA